MAGEAGSCDASGVGGPSRSITKLQQQPDVNLPLPEECEFPWLEGAINEVWDKWSDKIWLGQLKPRDIGEMVNQMVDARVLSLC